MPCNRVFFAIPLIGLLLLSYPASAQARVVEQVIVVIDGEPHTLSEWRQYAKNKTGHELPAEGLNSLDQKNLELLEAFITEKLLAAEVRQAGIRISEGDVDRYMDQIKQQNRISDEEMVEALRREGMTMEKYRTSIRAEMEKAEIIDRQVRQRVNITSEDVERYYRSNPKKFVAAEKVHLRHILLSLPERASGEREKEVALRIQEIRRRALAGEEFAKLARAHSEGPGAAEGGDIGWVKRGSLLKEIEEVAFGLSVGEISRPVRTALGLHLIKLEAREGERPLPLAEVGGKIKEELYAKALEERFQKWLKTDLRKRHRVDVKIPGVSFRPAEEKKGTVDTLIASASRRRSEERDFWSYLNPFSYIFQTTPMEEDGQGESSDRGIISLFGQPLFVTETAENVPDDPLAPLERTERREQKSQESPGFFSSIWRALNPFSSD